jgi:hypothetical protein
MFLGRILLLLCLGSAFCLATGTASCAEGPRNALEFPLPANSYQDEEIPSVFGKLAARIEREPFNLVATIIFLAAIVHTFLTAQFRKIAHRYQRRYETIEESPSVMPDFRDSGKERDRLIFRAQFFSFMGEVEAVFGIWLVPLVIAIIAFHGRSTMVDYVGHVNVADAIFVVAIMAIGEGTPASWWLAILTIGPLLGSFITGPAAMTICALLLRHHFYSLHPSK